LRSTFIFLFIAGSLAAGQYSGFVRSAGRPIPGATVAAAQGSSKVVTSTDESGRFIFEDLAAADGLPPRTPHVFSNVRGTSEAGGMAVFLFSLREPDLLLRKQRLELNLRDDLCEDVPAWWLLVLTRILGVPLIAGLSFEVIKWAGRNRRHRWVQAIMYPGLQLQRLTTREPDPDQLAVAIAALDAVLAVEIPGQVWAQDLVGVEVVA